MKTATRYIDTLKQRAAWFLYTCDDGTQEFMGPEGGQFKELGCEDPIVHPLFEGGIIQGRRLSELHHG